MIRFEVEIEPTAHTVHNGYDLCIRTWGHGWTKSDLTREELTQIRDKITEFLEDVTP